MIYAQLNEENVCVGISDLSGEVQDPHLIPLKEFDLSIMGKRYENSMWKEVEKENEPTPPPSDMELLMQAITDSEIKQLQAEQDRALLGQQLTDIELKLLKGGEKNA